MTTDSEIIDRLQAKDSLLFGLSDTLDVKASIALVVITFLATQTAGSLATPGLLSALRGLQIVSAGALAAAGVTALWSLWPRNHDTETAEEYDVWEQQLREHFKDDTEPDQAVAESFRNGRIMRLKERIVVNGKIDQQKSALVGWSYALTGLAFLLNMATLLGIAVS